MDNEAKIIDGLMEDAEAALARGSLNKATSIYQGILAIDPKHVTALRQLGAIALNAGEAEKGLALFRAASVLEPRDPDLYHGIATALERMGQTEQAILALNAALRVDSTHGPALYDKAVLLRRQGKNAAAEQAFLKAAQRNLSNFEAVMGRGAALFHNGNLLVAERWFQQAGRIKPDEPGPYINLAMIYRIWGFVPEAVKCLEHAVTMAPASAEAHWNLANTLLVNGDYARGFAEYEWRFKREGRGERAENIPRWKGEALDGREILITAEQGIGDAIQFVRFAGNVAARGGRVVLECHPGLESLLATAKGVSRVVRFGAPVPSATCYAPLMSLPHLLGVTLDTVPADVPYLAVPKDTPPPAVAETGPRVGLVWRGNPKHEHDRWRSVPLKLLAPLFEVPGVAFFSLQVGEAAAELAASPWKDGIADLAPQLTDFARTAAAVRALDLVITVDTAVAHLAGALNTPVWVLIQRGNDWRWLHERDDSPWYPSLRLFRQARPRDWSPAVKAMAERLAALAEE